MLPRVTEPRSSLTDGGLGIERDVRMTSPVASPLHTWSRVRFALVAAVCACSGSKPSEPVAPPPPAPPAQTGIDLPGDANGLYWDRTEHALYLTDATHDHLVRWTDGGGFAEVATLPHAAKSELGGLVKLADGRFAITSFGFGSDGGVLVVGTDHQVTSVADLDRTRRRIGIAAAPDGTLYDAYFVVADGKHHGGIAKLDLAHGETDVPASPLAKAVGVAATGDALYVSDQEQGAIYAVRAGATTPVATGLASADLLTVLPGGALVTGGKAGAVTELAPDGKVTTLASGFEQVRGTAYDPDGKRLFFIEHSKATSNHKLHVLPLP